MPYSLSKLADALIDAFEIKQPLNEERKITVNILVTKVASWYEKLRTSMDYGSEETILRRAIERILKRRLFLNENPKHLAESLVRELIWAGYFPNGSVPELIIGKVAESFRIYLRLKDQLIEKKIKINTDLFEYIVDLLSCDIDVLLLPNKEKEAMINFMFQVLQNSVNIIDDSKQTRDVQIFIAVRKNFGREDIAFLRYRLFKQIFGKLSDANINLVVSGFEKGFKEIEYQLNYPKKEKIFSYIKKVTPAFLILYDILMQEKTNFKNLVKDEATLKNIVFSACANRYKNINKKVRTAIIRSFIFIILTKTFIALFIEGAFERIFYGQVQWFSIILNTTFTPALLLIAGFGIKTPKEANSEVIYTYIQKVLFQDNPQLVAPISLKLKPNSAITIKDRIFSLLWILTILLSFGLISLILSKLHFNLLSQGVFLFFIAIISFLIYRIYQTASTYTVIFKQNIFTPILDFFFVPIIRVGKKFTEGITQINFVLIIIDFIIEAPFKGLVGFFEQWFSFVATKREELE